MPFRFSHSRFDKKNMLRGTALLTICLFFCLSPALTWAATVQTQNFTVSAHDPRIAKKMAARAEDLRKSLAELWLGESLPNWYQRAEIIVQLGNMQPNGETSFVFDNGEVFGWKMVVKGSEARVYDCVLPHEITHMILASYFRRPVPRWADEGAATFTESIEERRKYQQELLNVLKQQRGIPMDQLFAIKQYPRDFMSLYSQGHSIAEFLIRQRGPKYFVYFVERSMQRKTTWSELVHECYGYESLQELQSDWVAWVADGSPEFLGSNLIAGDQHNNLSNPHNNLSADQGPQITGDTHAADAGVVLAAAESVPDEARVSHAVLQQPSRASAATFQGDGYSGAQVPRENYDKLRWQSINIEQK